MLILAPLVCLGLVGCFDPKPPSSETEGSSGASTNEDGITSGTDGATSGADETMSGSGGCGDDGQCVPLAPEGWDGPVVVLLGTGTAPACPAQAPEELFIGRAGLSAPPAECSCECSGGSCDTTLYASLAGGCTEDLPVPVTEGMCEPIDTSAVPADTTVFIPPTGVCEPQASERVSPLQWGDEVRVCTGSLGSCGDGACVPPSVAGEGVCIVRDGEHTCPLSGYTQSFVFHRSADDTRGCSTCDCGGDLQCTLDIYQDPGCSGMPFYSAPLDSEVCEPIANVIPNGQEGPVGLLVESMGQCTPQGGESSGEATPADPFTLCCQP